MSKGTNKRDARLMFSDEKKLLCCETDASGVGLGVSLLHV